MNTAHHWYASATLWTITGVVVATIAAIVAALQASWVMPKRRLLYSMTSRTRLLHSRSADVDSIEVFVGGARLEDPYVVRVKLQCRGRRDISSSAFDQSKPLELDFGARIVQVLKFNSDSSTPSLHASGQFLQIGPGLIRKRQEINIDLLVEGSQPRVTCHNSPLIDVDVAEGNDPNQAHVIRLKSIAVMLALLAAGVATALRASGHFGKVNNWSADIVFLMMVVMVIVVAVDDMVRFVAAFASRRIRSRR